RVSVIRVSTGDVVKSFDLPKTAALEFSPLNRVLGTWQQYTIISMRSKHPSELISKCTYFSEMQENPQGEANLQLWDLPALKRFIRRRLRD
ncbi:hypothetical protein cypCar_00027981, partial [Cyprinus carpio]